MTVDKRVLLGAAALLVAIAAAVVLWPRGEPAPLDAAEDEPAPGPCEGRPRPVWAERLSGPHASLEALCAAWADGSCEPVDVAAADNFLPFDEVRFIQRHVADDQLDERPAVALAVRIEDRWWILEAASRIRETLSSHSFSHRQHADDPPIVEIDATWERRFYHSPGDPNGAVQVLGRHALLLCSAGPSGTPSCLEIPLRWSRETHRPGEEPSDIAVSQLAYTWCDNGNVLYEGTLERLSRDNEQRVEQLLGLIRPRFP